MATVRKRVRNGKVSYEVRYYTPDGRQKGETFTRAVDANRRKTEVEHSKLKGSYVDPTLGKVTFAEWAERWYASTAGLRPSTRDNYRRQLDAYLLPHFARTPLTGIDPLAVREWQAAMATAGLGAVSVRTVRAVLHLVLASAVEGGRLNRNPVTGVKPPKAQRKEMHFLDHAQVDRLAAAIEPHYRTLVYFAAYTGLRPSEQAALRVGRLDLLRRAVRVAEAAVQTRAGLAWGPTKTGEARTVKLPRFLCDLLAAHLAGRQTGLDTLVFTTPKGAPVSHGNLWRSFRAAVRAAGLPEDLRYYDLRHTAASLMIREGASVKAVQKQLGHRTATMTLDVYGHLFPDELEAVADRLDEARARAAEAWSQDGPEVVALSERAGQRASGGQ